MEKKDATFDDEERPVDVDMTPDTGVSAVVWTADDEDAPAERGDGLHAESDADIHAVDGDVADVDADIPDAEVAPSDDVAGAADGESGDE